MTQDRLILDIGEYAIWFAFLASALFPVITSWFWPWWKTTWGWNIITLELAIALALLPSWLRLTFGLRATASTAFAWVAVASVFIVGAVVTWRGILIWRTQRHGGDLGGLATARASCSRGRSTAGYAGLACRCASAG